MSSNILSISAELSAPPSSPSCFRDLSLQGSIRGYSVIALSPKDLIDYYNIWFKNYGLWDYLDDLVEETVIREEQVKILITGGAGSRLTAHNLHETLKHIPYLVFER